MALLLGLSSSLRLELSVPLSKAIDEIEGKVCACVYLSMLGCSLGALLISCLAHYFSLNFICAIGGVWTSASLLFCLAGFIALSNIGAYRCVASIKLNLIAVGKLTNIISVSLLILMHGPFQSLSDFLGLFIIAQALEGIIVNNMRPFKIINLHDFRVICRNNKQYLTISSSSGLVNNMSLNIHPILFNIIYGAQETAHFVLSLKCIGLVSSVFTLPTSRVFTSIINREVTSGRSIGGIYSKFFKNSLCGSIFIVLMICALDAILGDHVPESFVGYFDYISPLAASNLAMFSIGCVSTVLYSTGSFKLEFLWNFIRLVSYVSIYVVLYGVGTNNMLIFFGLLIVINNGLYFSLHKLNLVSINKYEKRTELEGK